MNRERLVSFIGGAGRKIADIYYELETNSYYVQYKSGIDDMGVIRYFNTEDEAEKSAHDYTFGEKYGERVV